jgi:hypothetical protein
MCLCEIAIVGKSKQNRDFAMKLCEKLGDRAKTVLISPTEIYREH